MPDPLISLDAEHVAVQPGGQARVTVTVTNTGTLVEGFWLQVLGPAAAWAEVVPPELSVYPQQEATAAVIISPPSDASTPSGLVPFGVLASSTLDADSSAAAEGDLEIGELRSLQAKIIPVTSAGRWRGRHVVQLSNWGNSTAQLRIVATDPDDALGFYVSPDYVELPAGGHATVRLSARVKRPMLRGTTVRIPFQVVGEPVDGGGQPPPATPYGDPSRPVVDAALNQRPILSKGVIALLALLLVGIAAAVAFILTRPNPGPEPLAPRGSPPKPVLRVVSSTADTITVAWDRVDQAERYTLQQVDPTGNTVSRSDPLDPALTTTTVTGLHPQTQSCFRLTVTRGGIPSVPSDVVCGTTTQASASPVPTPTPSAAASSMPPGSSPTSAPSPTPTPTPTITTPSPTPTPTITPGDPLTDPIMRQQWIAVAHTLPKTVPEADVQSDVRQLVAAGLNADYRDTQFYPRMLINNPTPSPIPSPSPGSDWIVFLGPFPTQQDAEVMCPQISQATGGTCTVAEPDPAQ